MIVRFKCAFLILLLETGESTEVCETDRETENLTKGCGGGREVHDKGMLLDEKKSSTGEMKRIQKGRRKK